MNFKKTMFALALGSVGIMGSMSAYAVAVNTGDVLTITPGTGSASASGAVTVTGGSFFRMVGVNAGLLSPGSDGGLKIGTTTAIGQIDAPWSFGGANGQDYVTVPVTGSTTAGLNMSGWTVSWSGNTIPMGTGAWNAGFSNGIGNFAWDGVYGHAYTLDYHATVQAADVAGTAAAGFANIKYNLHLQGVVNAAAAPVPEASTYGMMLAGLGLVGFAVRRRKII